jgi:hypothetical protein
MAAASPATLQAAFRRLLPCPVAQQYTAITCLPQRPGLLQRLQFSIASDPAGAAWCAAGAVVAVAAVTAACVAWRRSGR